MSHSQQRRQQHTTPLTFGSHMHTKGNPLHVMNNAPTLCHSLPSIHFLLWWKLFRGIAEHHAKAGSTSSWSPRVQLVTMEGTEGESTHLRHSFQSRAKLFGGCGRQRPDLVLALDLLRHDQPPRPLAQKAEVRLRLLREPFRQALCRLQLCRLIMQHAHVYSQTDSGDA
jgi:hypothetical protein